MGGTDRVAGPDRCWGRLRLHPAGRRRGGQGRDDRNRARHSRAPQEQGHRGAGPGHRRIPAGIQRRQALCRAAGNARLRRCQRQALLFLLPDADARRGQQGAEPDQRRLARLLRHDRVLAPGGDQPDDPCPRLRRGGRRRLAGGRAGAAPATAARVRRGEARRGQVRPLVPARTDTQRPGAARRGQRRSLPRPTPARPILVVRDDHDLDRQDGRQSRWEADEHRRDRRPLSALADPGRRTSPAGAASSTSRAARSRPRPPSRASSPARSSKRGAHRRSGPNTRARTW